MYLNDSFPGPTLFYPFAINHCTYEAFDLFFFVNFFVNIFNRDANRDS